MIHLGNLPVVQFGEKQLVWVKHLQSGSFGDVHELRDTSNGIRYAWKRVDMAIARGMLETKASTLEADNEMHILAQLTHPNIIKLWRFWLSHHRLSLLLEMCTEDLLYRLQRDGAMDRPHGRAYMVQLLRALAYLQKQEVAHRDVKLENLLVTASPLIHVDLKLCDFGLARRCSRLMGCATFIGSADYLAPEVRRCTEGRTYGFHVTFGVAVSWHMPC